MPGLPGPLRFARMAGSSVAAPGAAAWVTDFLNAAYYAYPEDERDVRALRLAHGILTTRWARRGRGRLGLRDVLALNRAYGLLRLRRRGRLDHEALLNGARSLVGPWFPAAWADPARRAHGIAFPTVADREAFDPGRRLRRAALEELTPPLQGATQQHWATYPPVALADLDAALRFLADPARWPDMGAAAGRFTAVRPGGLPGQTFEIEVIAEPTPRSPVFTRGYATCTALHLRGPGGSGSLDAAVADLAARYAAGAGVDAPKLLGDDATALALLVLTTHEGHFLGHALSHLLLWRDGAGTWIRDVGAWDPLPLHLAAAYATAGREAQQDFWGPEHPQRSMLAQLSAVSAADAAL